MTRVRHARGSLAREGMVERAIVLLAAIALDLLVGEPRGGLHPVGWIGSAIDRLERRAPGPERARSLPYGIAATLSLTVASAAAGLLAARALRSGPRPVRILTLACLLKPSFALRALIAAGSDVRRALERDDLGRAREALRSLVSRETAGLSAEECAAATIESLAENTADSFVSPWLAFLAFGLPGAWAFRAVNTLDSRWGYRGRYEWLGRTPAVLDDALAAVPARASAILLIAAAWLTGNSAGGAVHALVDDRTRTPSPNAGWTIAAMAGALGCRLAKPGVYTLNARGGACGAGDVARAQRLVAVSAALGLATVLPLVLLGSRGKPSSP